MKRRITISQDHHEATDYCEWLNRQGHDAQVGSSTGDYIDGVDVTTDEELQSEYNALWDEYCNGQPEDEEDRMKLTADMDTNELFKLAGTSGAELSIADHVEGYTHVVVELDGDTITDAWTTETIDGYYANTNPNIRSVVRVGTGSVPCNCDACMEDEDPAEWAGSPEHWPDFQQQVAEAARDLENGTYTA